MKNGNGDEFDIIKDKCYADIIKSTNLNEGGLRLRTRNSRFSYTSFLFSNAPEFTEMRLQCDIHFCIVRDGVPDDLCGIQSAVAPPCGWTDSSGLLYTL